MNKKKILLFSHEYPPTIGGAGIVAEQYFLELTKIGHSVTVLTKKSKGIKKANQNTNFIYVRYFPKIWLLAYLYYIKKLYLASYDTIILNDVTSVVVASLFFKKKEMAKSLVVLHGTEPEQFFCRKSLFFKLLRLESSYLNLLKVSRGILAVSKYMKEKFIQNTTFKDANKIKVVYAGLNDSFFLTNKKEKDSFFLKRKNKSVLLSVSRITKQKGYLEMYNIFKKLIEKDDRFLWVIVGDGDYKRVLSQMIDRDGLEDKIILLGALSRSALKKYYRASDLFWLLPASSESFGLAYIEAQACGCPAMGWDLYGIKEAIFNNKTGYLVKTELQVLSILGSKKFKKINKKECVKFSLKFKNEISKYI